MVILSYWQLFEILRHANAFAEKKNISGSDLLNAKLKLCSPKENGTMMFAISFSE